GSLTFLIAWACSLFFWSLPLSIVEYSLGRFTRTSPLGAFHKFLGNKLIWLGGWIVGVTYMITAYFSVIVGWCLYYLYKSCALSSLPLDEETSTAIFNQYARDSYWPVLTHVIAVLIVAVAIFGGINWIEKANMILVPMLLGILAFTFTWSLTRTYADVGIMFLFTPDWSSMLTPSLWVAAASQNAFDTGAAMALFISYSAYFTRKNGAVRFGFSIPLVNNMVSLICAITIFATVFSTLIQTSPTLTRSGILEIMQQNGPGSTGLTFTWIPVLFAYVGGFGRVLCVLFFLCLSFAGITSLIGHVQLTVITIKDLGFSHRISALLGLFLTLTFGLPSAMDIRILTNQDSVWGFALMLSGLAMAMLVVVYGPMRYRKVVVNDFGVGDWKLPVVWVLMISVLVPLCGIGLIVWWVYDLVHASEHWYHLTLDSMTTTLLEWFILLLILLITNGVALCRKTELFPKNKFVGYDPHNPEYIPADRLGTDDLRVIVVSALSVNKDNWPTERTAL
ncbi:Sodium dependent neurotransmitter transporter, partial [Fasciola gigantica]